MPAYEIIRKVNEELTALKPIIEEKLGMLEKKDATLSRFFEIADSDAIKSPACRTVSDIDREVLKLELSIPLTVSKFLGFSVPGDDTKSADQIKRSAEEETKKMLGFLKDRVVYVLPNYSAIRYGTASASDPAKNDTAQ